MSNTACIDALFLTYLLTAGLAWASRLLGAPAQKASETVHILGIVLGCIFTALIVQSVAEGQVLQAWGGWISIDALGAIFLGVTAMVAFLTGLYSVGYIRNDVATGEVGAHSVPAYYALFHFFVLTMMLAASSNNLVMMWVAIEATTLSSVFLVGFYQTKIALEAAWKYIIVCTVGVALGLYGTVLVFSNADNVLNHAPDAILWTEVVRHADLLDPALITLAFVFVFIGFGTKAGLCPMHTWLPDAHGSAPSPVSGLLSSALLSCALLVILRYGIITAHVVGAAFVQKIFLVFGLLSLGVAAFSIFMQRDIKRLLAYSSVENMGIIAIGFGFGGPFGTAAALLHVINHSFAKSYMFCCAGNLRMTYGTTDLGKIKGLLHVVPATGVLFMAGALTMGGMPPFNIFMSEFLTATAGVKTGHLWLVVLCLILLTIVLTSFARVIKQSVFGARPEPVPERRVSLAVTAPLILMLTLVFLGGIFLPHITTTLIANARDIVLVTPVKSANLFGSRGVCTPSPEAEGEIPCPN